MKIYFYPLFMAFFMSVIFAVPTLEWNATFGGPGDDTAYSVQQASDGGYILTGQIRGTGSYDIWLVKTDFKGAMQWNRSFGGNSDDTARSVQQTSDGGYVIAGTTASFGAGGTDFWFIKTDSTGAMQWNKTFGGSGWDTAYSMDSTSDGGYVLAGETRSFGVGHPDFWLVKTDSNGTMQWNKPYNKTAGGANTDMAYSVQQTSDGGYILAGYTQSLTTGDDVWLVKTNSTGAMEWNATFGGNGNEEAYSVQQTSDGGYILAATAGNFWLIKINSTGAIQWNKAFAGSYDTSARSVQQTSDGGYILAGYTDISGAGNYDFWLIKTNSTGAMQWNKTFGGDYSDAVYSVQQTSDGNYIAAGQTTSYDSGWINFWLVRVNDTSNPTNLTANLTLTVDPSTATYPTQTIASCTASSLEVQPSLYRDGVSVSNSDVQVLPVGVYNYTCNTSENQNYAPASSQLTINRKQKTRCSLALTPASATYGQSTTATCSCTNLEAPANMYRDGTDITSENGVPAILPAGGYTYTCNVSQTQNYSAATSTSKYKVVKARTYLTLAITPSSAIYPTQTNASCSASNSQVLLSLYKNSVLVANPDVQTLRVGTYFYTCNTLGNQNYSSASASSSLTIRRKR